MLASTQSWHSVGCYRKQYAALARCLATTQWRDTSVSTNTAASFAPSTEAESEQDLARGHLHSIRCVYERRRSGIGPLRDHQHNHFVRVFTLQANSGYVGPSESRVNVAL